VEIDGRRDADPVSQFRLPRRIVFTFLVERSAYKLSTVESRDLTHLSAPSIVPDLS
jgi:hypothetical protein